MSVLTVAQIRAKILLNDEYLKDLGKNPKSVIKQKLNIDITPKQSDEISKIISDIDNLALSFKASDQKGTVGAINWKKVRRIVKAAAELVAAILS